MGRFFRMSVIAAVILLIPGMLLFKYLWLSARPGEQRAEREQAATRQDGERPAVPPGGKPLEQAREKTSKAIALPSPSPSPISSATLSTSDARPVPTQPAIGLTRAPASLQIKINFQHPATVTPEGYLPDSGELFGKKTNGLTYGWLDHPVLEAARERGKHPDKRYDTFIHLTKGKSFLGPHLNDPGAPDGEDGAVNIWAIELANAIYRVRVVMGDPVYHDHRNSVIINGQEFADADPTNDFDVIDADIPVSDGRLVLRPAPNAEKPVVCFIEIGGR